MQLSTKGRYAVMAMLRMRDASQNYDIVPLSYISQTEDISMTYLEQLFTKLRKTGLVHSQRGQSGGYILAKQPECITLSEIILAVDENLLFTKCNPMSHIGCTKTGVMCRTHRLWGALSQNVLQFLSNVTLEDLGNGNFPVSSSSWLIDKQVAND